MLCVLYSAGSPRHQQNNYHQKFGKICKFGRQKAAENLLNRFLDNALGFLMQLHVQPVAVIDFNAMGCIWKMIIRRCIQF